MVFPVVMYGWERWTVKKAEHRRIDAFELWCWRRLLRVPWTTRRSNQLVQFSCSVVSDSLRPHRLQHTRPPCPSPTPGVYPKSCSSSQWCHPNISSSVVPFSCCPQSFPASGSFQMSQFFTSGGQSTGVSASASVIPMNIQDWSPLGWTGWISLQSKGLSRVFSNTTVQKHQFFGAQLSLQSNAHIHTWLLDACIILRESRVLPGTQVYHMKKCVDPFLEPTFCDFNLLKPLITSIKSIINIRTCNLTCNDTVCRTD